jgi:S1-C subfamily serine protease
LHANDVILNYNSRQVNNIHDLEEAQIANNNTGTTIIIFRNQKEINIKIR